MLRLSSRKVPSVSILAELYQQGLSPREIAQKLTLNINTVTSAMQRWGLLTRTPKETKVLQKARGIKTDAGKGWRGKKQPPEMVEKRISKIRGENHWLWKGGKESRRYRKVVTKEYCERCGTIEQLAIHHKDLDHYNDDPRNLAVLCSSCHASVHKQL